MNKEEVVRLEASKEWAELEGLIMRMKVEEHSAYRELGKLNGELPKVLVDWAKGNVSRQKVNKVKARIGELQELIKDLPLILKELEVQKRRLCYNALQEACVLSKERGKYKTLKEMIFEHFEAALAEDLRRCAKDIGEEEDCEKFLACVSPELLCDLKKSKS
ncbi:hypothetical protein SBDP1_1170027 [Syntrophobacter sp. SbD1]|nr:hypothetical protein SBDP1_1170027 [Syntrophobacter sp. SbD1]